MQSCPFCGNNKSIEVKTIIKEMEIRGEVIHIEREYGLCLDCGDAFEELNEEYDPYDKAYREYRRRKGWVQPEEIRAFREELGLTQKQLSDLLGIGIATLNRYENGALQSEANNQLIALCIEDRHALLHLIKTNTNTLPESEREHLIHVIENDNDEVSLITKDIINDLGSYPADIHSGGKTFDFLKFTQVVKFFCFQSDVFKTKLLKLLFYADFKHYKRHGKSITGARYVHLPLGPVPDNYKTWLLIASDWLNLVESHEIDFGEYSGEAFRTDKQPDFNLFSQEEIETLVLVKENFSTMTASFITKFSHQEPAYQETEPGQKISYAYAGDLQI